VVLVVVLLLIAAAGIGFWGFTNAYRHGKVARYAAMASIVLGALCIYLFHLLHVEGF
jgi:hypothetical protein